MQIFVFEFVTAGGQLAGHPASGSLLAEGDAMLKAVAADFADLSNVHVVTLRAAGLAPFSVPNCEVHALTDADTLWHDFDECARQADWSLIIAPELDGILYRCCRRVLAAGGRLLGPSPEVVRLASNKHETIQQLRDGGIPTPEGGRLAGGDIRPSALPYPVVIKPSDGAGSLEVTRVDRAEDLAARKPCHDFRWETYCPGIAASVGVLSGTCGLWPLVPCHQRLASDGSFAYLGGCLPLEPKMADRARALAVRSVACLPNPTGFIGVDLVLGIDDDGRQDVVIEINPRLTTSYVGLRAIVDARSADANLAAALVASANGDSPRLAFSNRRVEFDADGTVRGT